MGVKRTLKGKDILKYVRTFGVDGTPHNISPYLKGFYGNNLDINTSRIIITILKDLREARLIQLASVYSSSGIEVENLGEIIPLELDRLSIGVSLTQKGYEHIDSIRNNAFQKRMAWTTLLLVILGVLLTVLQLVLQYR